MAEKYSQTTVTDLTVSAKFLVVVHTTEAHHLGYEEDQQY